MTIRHLALVLTFLFSIPGVAAAGDEVEVRGGGRGHAIGMAQHGARAMAETGSTAEDIVTYFYTGAQLGTVGEDGLVGHADPLLIGIGQDLTELEFEPVNGAIDVCVGRACSWSANPGDGLDWSYRSVGGGMCQFFNAEVGVGDPGECRGELEWTDQPNIRVSIPLENRVYARGRILFVPAPNNRFHAVVEIGLEEYLYGLGEMPSSWPAEALKAQVIAARSYGLYKAWTWRRVGTGSETTTGELNRLARCACHLYAHNYDQTYIGWAKESEESGGVEWGQRWVAAVDDTKDIALTHTVTSGKALQAYYSASTGGATENNEDVWGGSPLPYLRSVPDPGATSWVSHFTRGEFANALGLICVGRADITATYDSGSPSEITVEGTRQEGPVEKYYSGAEFKSALGLDSHHVLGVDGLQVGSTGAADGDHLLKYRGSDGSYRYRDVDAAGCSLKTIGTGTYASDWTSVEAVDLDGDNSDELLLYRADDGRYQYRNLNTDGSLGSIRSSGAWAPGWTNVEPVRFAGGDARDELMFYRRGDGRFAYYEIKSDGGIGSAVRVGYFGPGWTSAEPLDINGDGVDEMFFYRATDGRFAYYYLRPDGTIGHSVRKDYFGVGWDTIEPTDFDGDATDEMLYYRMSDGRYAIYDLSLGGDIGSSMGVGNYAAGFVTIASPAD